MSERKILFTCYSEDGDLKFAYPDEDEELLISTFCSAMFYIISASLDLGLSKEGANYLLDSLSNFIIK